MRPCLSDIYIHGGGWHAIHSGTTHLQYGPQHVQLVQTSDHQRNHSHIQKHHHTYIHESYCIYLEKPSQKDINLRVKAELLVTIEGTQPLK